LDGGVGVATTPAWSDGRSPSRVPVGRPIAEEIDRLRDDLTLSASD
jgi:hypothetical protein